MLVFVKVLFILDKLFILEFVFIKLDVLVNGVTKRAY
jgi:hypothetical protein